VVQLLYFRVQRPTLHKVRPIQRKARHRKHLPPSSQTPRLLVYGPRYLPHRDHRVHAVGLRRRPLREVRHIPRVTVDVFDHPDLQLVRLSFDIANPELTLRLTVVSFASEVTSAINCNLTRFARFPPRLRAHSACERLHIPLAFAGTLMETFPSRASVPIQHFLAWRIKNLSHRWVWFFVVSALSLGQGSCAFIGGVLASTTARYFLLFRTPSRRC
jgi:hypothetical protein